MQDNKGSKAECLGAAEFGSEQTRDADRLALVSSSSPLSHATVHAKTASSQPYRRSGNHLRNPQSEPRFLSDVCAMWRFSFRAFYTLPVSLSLTSILLRPP